MILESKKSPLLVDSWKRVLTERAASKETWMIRPDASAEGGAPTRVSYGELYECSAGIAGALWKRGVREGNRVVLALDNGPEFCFSFFALLLMGAVPVPFPPPYALPMRGVFCERLSEVLAHCAAECVIISKEVAQHVGGAIARSVPLVEYDELRSDSVLVRTEFPDREQSDLAVIQYTSGTTGTPRAVELTHGNILHNVNGIVRGLDGPSRDSVVVCWLPMFHDMGLIGSMLAATYAGAPLVMMTPREFIMRPEFWLWSISRFRGTISAAPNFAYKLCVGRIRPERLTGLDLGAWTAALTGAENVDAGVVEDFERRFRRYGLPESATMPVYGLAENTVACSFSARGAGAYFDRASRDSLQGGENAAESSHRQAATRLVAAVGTPLCGQRVRVITTGGEARDREVGEVQISGPCVMRAYHRDPQATAAAISNDGWLRTGDRGYITGGRLHVLGRLGDVIKRGGQRYDAEDIVAAAHRVGNLDGRVAAFGVPNRETGTESIILLLECESGDPEQRRSLETSVRRMVYERTGVQPDVVTALRRGTLPRTTSGKVNNKAARAAFLGAEI